VPTPSRDPFFSRLTASPLYPVRPATIGARPPMIGQPPETVALCPGVVSSGRDFLTSVRRFLTSVRRFSTSVRRLSTSARRLSTSVRRLSGSAAAFDRLVRPHAESARLLQRVALGGELVANDVLARIPGGSLAPSGTRVWQARSDVLRALGDPLHAV
jgi:hypothetical protein